MAGNLPGTVRWKQSRPHPPRTALSSRSRSKHSSHFLSDPQKPPPPMSTSSHLGASRQLGIAAARIGVCAAAPQPHRKGERLAPGLRSLRRGGIFGCSSEGFSVPTSMKCASRCPSGALFSVQIPYFIVHHPRICIYKTRNTLRQLSFPS